MFTRDMSIIYVRLLLTFLSHRSLSLPAAKIILIIEIIPPPPPRAVLSTPDGVPCGGPRFDHALNNN